MDVTPLIRPDSQVIQAYRDGTFKVSGVIFPSAITVSARQTHAWPVAPRLTVSELYADDFAFLEMLPETRILLVGTGAAFQMMPSGLKDEIKKRYDVIADVMDTGAACRTYNVLMAEGRDVVAALLPFRSQ